MPAHRPPSPRPIPDPSPRELVQGSGHLLPPGLGDHLVIRDREFPIIERAEPLVLVGPPPPLPRRVLVARVAWFLSAGLMAAGLVGTLVVDVTGAWAVAAGYAAGGGVVGVLATSPASCRPETEGPAR